jgi:hypothetical protein
MFGSYLRTYGLTDLRTHHMLNQRICVTLAIAAAALFFAQTALAATSCVDSAETPGGTCSSQSTCDGAAPNRETYTGDSTNCEADGKICCIYTAQYLNTMGQTCASQGGSCLTSCAATQKADPNISCPGSQKCCVAKTCDDLKGACMDASICATAGDTVVAGAACPSGTTGQCCVPKGTVQGGTQAPGAKASLPGAGTSAKGTTVVAYGLKNPLGSRSLNDIAAALIKYASGIAGTLMLVMLLWGGVEYMQASDPKSVSDARGRIVWSLLGIAVIFFAYIVIDAVISVSSLAPGT